MYNNKNYNNKSYNYNKILKELYDVSNIQHKVQIKNLLKKFNCFKIIPKGIKCILQFNYNKNNKKNIYQNNSQLLFIDLKSKKIKKIKDVDCFYSNNLINGTYNGTQIYGTYIEKEGIQYFIAEDIIFYKNKYILNETWKYKLDLFYDFFNFNYKTPSEIITNNELFCYLCYFNYDILTYEYFFEERNIKKLINYDIFKIQFIDNNSNTYGFNLMNYLKKNITNEIKKLYIKATTEFDIYKCYTIKDKKMELLGKLHIPNYISSVKLNKLFRNIIENENIDYIEESDDEDNFQNESFDKFVDLNKTLLMKCKFNNKMNKWEIMDYEDFTPLENNIL